MIKPGDVIFCIENKNSDTCFTRKLPLFTPLHIKFIDINEFRFEVEEFENHLYYIKFHTYLTLYEYRKYKIIKLNEKSNKGNY